MQQSSSGVYSAMRFDLVPHYTIFPWRLPEFLDSTPSSAILILCHDKKRKKQSSDPEHINRSHEYKQRRKIISNPANEDKVVL
jgi:hypothetical protein